MSISAITTTSAAAVLFGLIAFSAYGTETGKAVQANIGNAVLTQGAIATGEFAAQTQAFRE
jgi:hypothetical protein